MKNIKIPCIIAHNLTNGHTINLKHVPTKGTVSVYTLNADGTLGKEIEYGKYRSKYKYSLSGSILHLPSCLDKNTEVLIIYIKKVNIEKCHLPKFCRLHLLSNDTEGNIKDVFYEELITQKAVDMLNTYKNKETKYQCNCNENKNGYPEYNENTVFIKYEDEKLEIWRYV